MWIIPHQRKRVFILAVRSDLSADGHARIRELLEDSNSSRERQGEQGRPNGQERRAVDGGGAALFQRTASADHARSTGVRGRQTMEHAESRGLKGAGGGGRPEQSRVHEQVREPSTGADLAHTHNAGDAGEERGDLWPAGRGARQYAWEPPRVTPREPGDIKPSVGGGVNGCAGGVGYGDLRSAVDSRTDELRLLGNGVVPATAERAFRVLWEELTMENAHAIYSD